MRRSTVLTHPPQLVFPGETLTLILAGKVTENDLCAIFSQKFKFFRFDVEFSQEAVLLIAGPITHPGANIIKPFTPIIYI